MLFGDDECDLRQAQNTQVYYFRSTNSSTPEFARHFFKVQVLRKRGLIWPYDIFPEELFPTDIFPMDTLPYDIFLRDIFQID